MSDARAPIDPGLLRHVLAPTLGASRTLPAAAYLSPEVLAWEQERFFKAGWLCVGRADDLAQPGDQRAVRVGEEGVLLVRDERGRLNAFSNTCRHRGHELLEPGTQRQPPRDQVPVPRVGVRAGRFLERRPSVRRRCPASTSASTR